MPIKDKTGKGLTIQLPSLVGTQQFIPSALMIRVLCSYLQAQELNKPQSAIQILKKLGNNVSNWYLWQKKDGFTDWWNRACADYHTNIGLSSVYGAIHRRATGNSPQDAKLYLERFDKDYKPTTGQEHTFPGIAPPDKAEEAVERSRQRAEQRKQIASNVK